MKNKGVSLVVAPSFRVAQAYFVKHQKNYYAYKLIDDAEKLMGLRRGRSVPDVLWLTRDESGWFYYPKTMRDLIREICEMDMCGNINIQLIVFWVAP